MTTRTEDRLLGIAVAALLTALGGELLSVPTLVAVGVTGFFAALVALFAAMTVALVVGVSRTADLEMLDSTVADRTH